MPSFASRQECKGFKPRRKVASRAPTSKRFLALDALAVHLHATLRKASDPRDMVLVRPVASGRSRRRGRPFRLGPFAHFPSVQRHVLATLPSAACAFLLISQLLDKPSRYGVIVDPSIWCSFVSPQRLDHEHRGFDVRLYSLCFALVLRLGAPPRDQRGRR